MRIHPTLLLLPLLFVACDKNSPTSPVDSSVPFVTVAKASYSGFSTPVRETVRGTEEWVTVWQTLYAGRGPLVGPMPPLPEIDFDREMVVLVAAGTRRNGCFAIDVTRARLKGNGAVEFEVTETVPGPTCVCTFALTQPVHVVKLARLPGPETFVERRAESRC